MKFGLVFFALSLLLIIQLGSIETRSILSREEEGDKSSKSNDFIHDLCNRTSGYNDCVSTIESDPRIHLKTNPKGFVRILSERAVANATTAKKLVANLLKNATGKWTIGVLNLCYSNYDVSIHSLNRSLGLIDNFTKDYDTYKNLVVLLGTVYVEVADCDYAWTEKPARKSPLTTINDYLGGISEDAKEIVNIIYCNHWIVCPE